MNGSDLRKIIGATREGATREGADYIPVAMLLRSGQACFGHFHARANEGLDETLVVLNAQLVELHTRERGRLAVEDFRDFLVEMVTADGDEQVALSEKLPRPIPLIAIAVDEITIVYPVSQIVELLRRIEDRVESAPPGESSDEGGTDGDERGDRPFYSLMDLDQDETLALLKWWPPGSEGTTGSTP